MTTPLNRGITGWRSWLPRFSLWHAFASIAFVVLGSLAIANPNQLVQDACVAITFTLFPLAASLAIAAPHSRRYFALGFIVWGGGFVALGLLKHWEWYHDELLTTQFSNWLYALLDRNSVFPQPIYLPADALPADTVPAYADPFGPSDPVAPSPTPLPNSNWLIFRTTMHRAEFFVAICECLWTILFGLIGGWITASIYRANTNRITNLP